MLTWMWLGKASPVSVCREGLQTLGCDDYLGPSFCSSPKRNDYQEQRNQLQFRLPWNGHGDTVMLTFLGPL